MSEETNAKEHRCENTSCNSIITTSVSTNEACGISYANQWPCNVYPYSSGPSCTLSFGGSPDYSRMLDPEKVIFSGKTTIVIWKDGTETRATCDKLDTFDEEAGFAVCLMKKVFGKKVFGKKLYKRIVKKGIHSVKNSKKNKK